MRERELVYLLLFVSHLLVMVLCNPVFNHSTYIFSLLLIRIQCYFITISMDEHLLRFALNECNNNIRIVQQQITRQIFRNFRRPGIHWNGTKHLVFHVNTYKIFASDYRTIFRFTAHIWLIMNSTASYIVYFVTYCIGNQNQCNICWFSAWSALRAQRWQYMQCIWIQFQHFIFSSK